MRKRLINIGISLAILLSVFTYYGCEPDKECNFSTVAVVNFSLNKDTGSTISQFILTPINSFNDTIFQSGDNRYIATLPLSISEDSTVFAFYTNSGDLDTVIFHHSMQLTLLDEACGYVPQFELLKCHYTSNALDSIAIIFRDVTTDIESDNIKIYY